MEFYNTEADSPLLLTPKDVEALLNVGRVQVYRLMERHGFPRPIYLSPQSRRWKASEVQAWIESRQAGASSGGA